LIIELSEIYRRSVSRLPIKETGFDAVRWCESGGTEQAIFKPNFTRFGFGKFPSLDFLHYFFLLLADIALLSAAL